MARRSAILSLYRGLGYLVDPGLRVLVGWRERHNKEDPERRGERRGFASVQRPEGRLIWIHAASVGETNAVLPLIGKLSEMDWPVLLTTTTVTAAQVAERRLPDGMIHQYVPFDVVPSIRRFLDTWRPDLAIFVESEIWPATLSELERRGTPSAVVNGRLSKRSWSRWRKRRRIAETVFGMIGTCLTQSEKDAVRFRDLGAGKTLATGNLKFDGEPLPSETGALSDLERALDGRPIWVAASTHAGEEEVVADVHRQLVHRDMPELLTLIVPRHPDRGGEIAELVRSRGIACARRSQGDAVLPETGVYIADTIGEMGLFYRLAPVAFLGGSLVPFGGHNPIEPAQLGTALITGPHVQSFFHVFRDLRQAGALIEISNGGELAETVRHLLEDQPLRQDQAKRAQDMVLSGRGAVERTLDALQPVLRTVAPGDAG